MGTPFYTWCAEMDIQVCRRHSQSLSSRNLTYARCATEALEYLLPIVSPSLLSVQNNAKSTPLHWAALNSQLSIARALVRFPQGPGIDLIDIKNAAGRSSLGEAENAGWDEGAKWFVEVMNLDEGAKGEEELHPADGTEDIEVEIQDAEGQVAKMTIGQSASETSNKDVVKT